MQDFQVVWLVDQSFEEASGLPLTQSGWLPFLFFFYHFWVVRTIQLWSIMVLRTCHIHGWNLALTGGLTVPHPRFCWTPLLSTISVSQINFELLHGNFVPASNSQRYTLPNSADFSSQTSEGPNSPLSRPPNVVADSLFCSLLKRYCRNSRTKCSRPLGFFRMSRPQEVSSLDASLFFEYFIVPPLPPTSPPTSAGGVRSLKISSRM